ncbi:MAG: hypothetical protein RR232_03645 [Clostridia bacterium]
MAHVFICESSNHTPQLLRPSNNIRFCRGLSPRSYAPSGFIAWIDASMLVAYNDCCAAFGMPIYATGFHNLSSGSHPAGSAHYAGLAFDMGQGLDDNELHILRKLCFEFFDYVQPNYLTPRWVHAELFAKDLCGYFSYPFLEIGSFGTHVYLLQDALCLSGFPIALTGRFGTDTHDALCRFCYENALSVTSGLVDCSVWQALMGKVISVNHKIIT